jgi:hypothetical protein
VAVNTTIFKLTNITALAFVYYSVFATRIEPAFIHRWQNSKNIALNFSNEILGFYSSLRGQL